MSVLDRSALEASPLSDLHAIASELGLDGYRRLRRPELIEAIVARQEGAAPGANQPPAAAEAAEEEAGDEPAERAGAGARRRGPAARRRCR